MRNKTLETSNQIKSNRLDVNKFFFTINKLLKPIKKGSGLGSIFFTFLQRISEMLSFQIGLKLKNSVSGYVLVLMITLIPALLFGTRYVLDQSTLLNKQITGTLPGKENKLMKVCAQKIADEIAKKWNPALSYKEQRESMLRIADEIYNREMPYEDTLIRWAIPQIDIPKEEIIKGEGINPIKVIKTGTTETENYKPTDRVVEQGSEQDIVNNTYSYTVPSYDEYAAPVAMKFYKQIDDVISNGDWSLFTVDKWLTEKDKEEQGTVDISNDWDMNISHIPQQPTNNEGSASHIPQQPTNNEGSATLNFTVPANVVTGLSSTGTLISNTISGKKYKVRKDINDPKVKIECEKDKIKVTTDGNIAYAEPEKCDVDIVLAVPTNDSANTGFTNNNATSSSLYQITRSYQEFLKKFFYTRGVNVGVIPYSGKVSIKANATTNNWVREPDRFVAEEFLNEGAQPKVMGAMLYGTKGVEGANLSEIGTYGGKAEVYGLLCRGYSKYTKPNAQQYSNIMTVGDLLSTADPSSYKFRKMVYNPCYLTDANLLSMKCEKAGNKYWINPYYILELNPDVQYIYKMLGAFYPFYDDRNLSNFLFIPITWCNNLFQEWSKAEGKDAIDTKNDTTNLGRLKIPSSREADRKKALIMVINKPDWFEPGELTYIGFENDYSDTSAVESDEIRFDINYSDSNRKYADGSSYNGTIQGQKKILTYSTTAGSVSYSNGYYQCSSATGRLSYPKKWLLRVVVEPTSTSGTITFSNITTNSTATTTETQTITARKEFFIIPDQMTDTLDDNENYYVDFTMTNIRLISAELTNRPYTMENKKAKYTSLEAPERSVYINLLKQSLDGRFKYQTGSQDIDSNNSDVVLGDNTTGAEFNPPESSDFSNTSSSSNSSSVPDNWQNIKGQLPNTNHTDTHYSICRGNQYFVTLGYERSYAKYSSNGKTWEISLLPVSKSWYSVCYGNGKFVAVAQNSGIAAYITESDLAAGKIWTQSVLPASKSWYSVCYGNGKFVAVASDSNIAAYSIDGITWTQSSALPASKSWYSVCYGNGKFVAVPSGNNIAAYSSDGITWTQSSALPASKSWYSVCYGNGKFVAVAYNYGYAAYSSNGISWTQSNLPNSNYWYSVCYGNGKFVAVAYNYGYAAYSSNGISWTQSNLPNSNYWCSVCYGNGKFVAVTVGGNIAAYGSESVLEVGKTWTQSYLPSSVKWYSVCYGDGKFVAVASGSNMAAYSTDGITWTQSTLPSSKSWYSVCYGDGKFVAVASDSNIAAYSTDGITWTQSTLPSSQRWRSVCYGGGRFVVLAYSSRYIAYCSSNTMSWSQNTMPSVQSWSSVCYGNGKYVAVASSSNVVVYSLSAWDDWFSYTLPVSAYWKSVCYGGGKFVAVAGSSNIAAYSIDGKTWTQSALPASQGWNSVCYGGDKFVAVASDSNIAAYSTDGITWTRSTVPSSTYWYSVCYGENTKTLVAVAHNSNIAAYSTKGISWTPYTLPYLECWESLCYGNGTLVAVAYNSDIAAYITESDLAAGENWTQSRLPFLTCWKSVCHGNGKFVAVAYNSQIAAYITETDLVSGKIWTQSALPASKEWYSVCYEGDKFVAIACNSNIAAYSIDGITWIRSTLPASAYWYSVCYGGDKFVAIACNSNIVAYSIDGITWTQSTLPVSAYWYSVCYGGEKFVAVAYNSNIAAYSTDGIIWTQSTLPASAYWYSVCYGGGKFVAVAYSSNIAAYITGPDLTRSNSKWIQIYMPAYKYWNSVCCGENNEQGIFVAMDYGGPWGAYCKVEKVEVVVEKERKPKGWCYCSNNEQDSIDHKVLSKFKGDFYLTTNSDAFSYDQTTESIYSLEDTNDFSIDIGKTYFNINNGTATKYLGAGLYRLSMPLDKILWDSSLSRYYNKWDVKNLGDVPLQTLYAGSTLPVNLALFYGANGNTPHAYEWQSNSNGTITSYDTVTAVRQVTLDACTKLKTNWGSKLRIYLIKFRKQGTDKDYSYLNSCTDYISEITETNSDLAQTELTEELKRIATEIKDWEKQGEEID